MLRVLPWQTVPDEKYVGKERMSVNVCSRLGRVNVRPDFVDNCVLYDLP